MKTIAIMLRINDNNRHASYGSFNPIWYLKKPSFRDINELFV